MGDFCLLAELHQEGSAPAACAAGLFLKIAAQIIFKMYVFSGPMRNCQIDRTHLIGIDSLSKMAISVSQLSCYYVNLSLGICISILVSEPKGFAYSKIPQNSREYYVMDFF